MRDADSLDVAAELQDAFNRRGIEAVRAAAAQQTHPDFDGKRCIECAVKIPVARLKLGRINCVSCQDSLEKKQRFFR